MPKAILTTSEGTAYDDRPEVRYHFPKTYIAQAKEAEGEWVLYYEPRRSTGPNSATGRSAYFAIARIAKIEADPRMAEHFYAFIDGYLEFDQAVPFRDGIHYYESVLRKSDGTTNKGAFGRAVRPIPDAEFWAIVKAGFTREIETWESEYAGIAEEPAEFVVRPIIEQVINRKFRDEAFRRHVRAAYGNRCAISGLRLLNGGGRPEVQAAHIVPVEANGPDTVRNGLALTGTIHWLFDRGLLSIDSSYKIVLSPRGVPDEVSRLILPDRKLILPERPEWQPHAEYLRWHREHRFKQ